MYRVVTFLGMTRDDTQTGFRPFDLEPRTMENMTHGLQGTIIAMNWTTRLSGEKARIDRYRAAGTLPDVLDRCTQRARWGVPFIMPALAFGACTAYQRQYQNGGNRVKPPYLRGKRHRKILAKIQQTWGLDHAFQHRGQDLSNHEQ